MRATRSRSAWSAAGGRGTGATEQALIADRGNALYAMGDAFGDRIESSLSALKGSGIAGMAERIDVPPERRFVGFDAYKQVIDECDLVLLTTPPGFRPIHYSYAVEKKKHAFVEKPMAVDGPGLRKFMEAAKKSKELGLSLVNGFCWRYYAPRRELMARVHNGDIGAINTIETTYNSQGVWDPRRTREECKSEMEYQMRNWYYYSWLSGDHIVEQAVHGLDTMAWAMNDAPPERCWGVGGRQTRTEPKYGNIYDHFSIVYEYPDDVRGYHQCRHWANTPARGSPTSSRGPRAALTSSERRLAAPTSGDTAPRTARRPSTCTRPSITRCSPRSATASRSTMARRPPPAPCWP